MKKTLIVLISALVLLGSISTASAAYIENEQEVDFGCASDADLYWAMIYDYTLLEFEETTPGFINYSTSLSCTTQWDGIQVAYCYSSIHGRFVEYLALRDVRL